MKTGKHTVTALTRASSKGKFPDGVKVVEVDYDDEESIVSALRGQQFLAITLAARAPAEINGKIVNAASKAGVPYIMPNTYGGDFSNKSLIEDSPIGDNYTARREEVENSGATWISLVCGFWYEWSLALPEPWFGFTIKERKVTFFDDGNTKINTSTWDQCGRAIAGLLSLPESGASPSVSDWKNKGLYIDSFKVSQRDMLDSLHRVLGTTDQDWEITYERSMDRYKRGMDAMKKGDRTGFATAMYARVFFQNGDGDYESKHGLPKESLDDATKRTVEMVESGWSP